MTASLAEPRSEVVEKETDKLKADSELVKRAPENQDEEEEEEEVEESETAIRMRALGFPVRFISKRELNKRVKQK